MKHELAMVHKTQVWRQHSKLTSIKIALNLFFDTLS